ncbi:MAG: hypothetical protein JXQ27_12005, partial [Acidobacteria bacterium]|nr:hypothetical protein [Acidobacteriota bacterium]
MTLPVRHALQFLQDLLQPDLPSSVMGALAVAPVSAREKLEYRHRVRYARMFTHIPVNWRRFYRLLRSRGHSRRAALLELIELIRMEWDLPARWQVPCRLVFKGVERLIHLVRGMV